MGFSNDKPVNSLTLPAGAGTGTGRVVIGGDVPAELAFYNVTAALLFYTTDSLGVEIGYGFITNARGDLTEYPALMEGFVKYPLPGVPLSATPASVSFNIKHIIAKTGFFPQSHVEHLIDSRFIGNAYFHSQLQMLGFSLFNADVDSTVNLQGTNQVGPQLNDLGRGLVTSTSLGTDGGAIGATETAVLVVPSHDYLEGRAYRAIVEGGFKTSVANTAPIWRLRKTNVAGATVVYYRRTPSMEIASGENALSLSKVFTVPTGAGTVTAALALCTSIGTGTVTILGVTGGRSISIHDVGPASAWPDASTLT
jgi:hypothetical protein